MQRRRTAAPAAPAAARPCVAALPSRSWRECFCKPFELSPPNQEEKKDSSQQRATPTSSQPSERFQPTKKLQKICADTRLRSAQTKLPHWSIGDLFSPSEASQSKRPFHAASQRVSFGLHSGQLGEIIRSALKQIAQSEGSPPCFIHSMFAVQPARWWMAAYARPDVPH